MDLDVLVINGCSVLGVGASTEKEEVAGPKTKPSWSCAGKTCSPHAMSAARILGYRDTAPMDSAAAIRSPRKWLSDDRHAQERLEFLRLASGANQRQVPSRTRRRRHRQRGYWYIQSEMAPGSHTQRGAENERYEPRRPNAVIAPRPNP